MKKHLDALAPALAAEGVDVRGEDWGGMVAGQLKFAKGADLAPVLKGLPNDHCQCPHWGFVMEGRIAVTYTDGAEEEITAGEVYYWPPGHSVRFLEDTRYVEFSPTDQMMPVLAHVKRQMGLE